MRLFVKIFLLIALLFAGSLFADTQNSEAFKPDIVTTIGAMFAGFLSSLGGSYAVVGKWVQKFVENQEELKKDVRSIKDEMRRK